MPTNTPSKIPENSDETLKKYLIELNQTKKALEDIRNQLGDLLTSIDSSLVQRDTAWSEHREKYYQELTQQLKEHGIVLTEEEQKTLRYGDSTASSIQEIRDNLAKLNIKIPSNASDFAMVATGVVATALSRTLQKVDDAYNLVRKLEAVDHEDSAATKFKKLCKKQLEETKQTANALKSKATNTQGLTTEQNASLENITASVVTQSTANRPAEEPKNLKPSSTT